MRSQAARPAEDPGWSDRQIAGLREAPVEVIALVARQQETQVATWERFKQRYPRKAEAMRRRIDQAGRGVPRSRSGAAAGRGRC